jgi:hypothetical protein
MASSIEIKADINAAGKAVHSVVVTIDNHETIVRFASKDDAERFAQEERARLAEDEKIASQRVREIAYRLWQEEGCPEGEALRHWFAAKAILDSEAERDASGGEVRPHGADTELS